MPVTRRNRKSEEESSPNPEIDLTKIKDLIKLMEDHDLTAFELEDSGFKVRLEKGTWKFSNIYSKIHIKDAIAF